MIDRLSFTQHVLEFEGEENEQASHLKGSELTYLSPVGWSSAAAVSSLPFSVCLVVSQSRPFPSFSLAPHPEWSSRRKEGRVPPGCIMA